jgi:porin
MGFATRAFAASVLITLSICVAYTQEPPNATNNKPAATKPTPEPTPEPTDLWTQETMTGDWGGTRSRWKEKGIEFEFKLSNFVQGIASGGVSNDTEYNGKFEMKWKFDLGKVAGWKFWTSEIKTEFRYSGPALTGTGGINPSNTAEITPGSDGEVIAITAVNFTRLIPIDLQKGDLYVVSFGRFNLLDLIDEDFFGGAGTEKFMNIAQIGPLTVLREVPLVTNGVNFAYVKGGEPRFTFSLLDPNDHTLDPGLDDLFADGVTFYPGVNFPTKYGGKSGKHSFAFAITTKKFTPFDRIRQIIIPGPPANPIEPKRGSWSASYIFRQYFVERGHRDGWGFFSQVSFANPDTSPMTKFVSVGLGGNGLFKSRNNDEFGVAYAFSDLSNQLKDNIDLLTIGNRTLRPEHQFEAFYNCHITPWLRLTGDIQIIRGVRPAFDTAVVPGARLVMIF